MTAKPLSLKKSGRTLQQNKSRNRKISGPHTIVPEIFPARTSANKKILFAGSGPTKKNFRARKNRAGNFFRAGTGASQKYFRPGPVRGKNIFMKACYLHKSSHSIQPWHSDVNYPKALRNPHVLHRRITLSDVNPIAKTGVSFIFDPPVAVLKENGKETPLDSCFFQGRFMPVSAEQGLK